MRRCLCLHGFRQSKSHFKGRAGSLRRVLRRAGVELVFAQAPHVLPNAEDEGEAVRATWWHTAEGDDGAVAYRGWDESAREIRRLYEAERCDGVLGFSQGAVAVAALCVADPPLPNLQYAVMVSGFAPRDTAIAAALASAAPLALPTMHVWGTADEIVSGDKSERLSTFFEGPACVVHEGGHFVPTGDAVNGQYEQFFAGLEQ